MNDINPAPAAVPPRIPPWPPTVSGTQPLGENPEEREPIPNVIVAVEAILRQPRRVIYQLRQPGAGRLMLSMVFVAILCSLLYGVVVGTFSKGDQLWAAPAKICGGMLISAVICLPSLYIFTCLSGSQARLAEICGLVCGVLMLMTLLLIGFAPVAWLFSESTNSVTWMGTLHLCFWFISTFFGLRFLGMGFSHSHARSSAGLNLWIIIFLLVVAQMTTALRPIVGTAKTFLPAEKQFFLTHWTECFNAPTSNASPATRE
jgi:hypothetical protein